MTQAFALPEGICRARLFLLNQTLLGHNGEIVNLPGSSQMDWQALLRADSIRFRLNHAMAPSRFTKTLFPLLLLPSTASLRRPVPKKKKQNLTQKRAHAAVLVHLRM